MRKTITAFLTGILFILLCCCPVVSAASVPRETTTDYKVAFYAFDCYHMQDENGRRYGYGYDMMQQLSKFLPCTFSYVGYEKSAAECEDMLREGKLDIYTAAKITPERKKDFVFSKHPAITSTTCMNIKRGNNKVVPGDYSTYNGLRIGLLERHTYNDKFIRFTKQKGFECRIVYYSTPTELSNALVNGEVDALVNSYIRTPEDESTVENFGETPYYFMARKEDRSLINALDNAIDEMNVATPNWRTDLYNQYYGSQDSNKELTDGEQTLLEKMQADHAKMCAVMSPDSNPYSWYEGKNSYGIAADLFAETAKTLGIEYEIIPASSRKEYAQILSSGKADICLDMSGYYEDESNYKYKLTDPYLTTTVSVLRRNGTSGKMNRIGVLEDNTAIREIISSVWPNAKIIRIDNTKQCVSRIMDEKIDGALLMSYTAQKLAKEDAQNRLNVDIVPEASLGIKMGINADLDHHFFGLWQKTLSKVASNKSAELVQDYLERTNTPSLMAYLFDHPTYLVGVAGALFLVVLITVLYIASTRAKNKQLRISEQLAEALIEAQRANEAKVNFFSKMSHDIRTPLNVVLGMTQIAKKYKNDTGKLDNALENITTEGNYLLTMINSILDVNQLEHGHIELIHKPFNPDECMRESIEILRPLADKKEQNLTVLSDFKNHVVVGDAGRFSQIMVNIVSNAIKYTDIGGEIRIKMEALEGNRYRFICEDNGIGMTHEFLQHICDDYSREEDSRISSIEGAGLGMSVVKGFTELMHGTLQIESEPGKGSVFLVEIPFDEPSIKERDLLLNSRMEHEKEQFSEKYRGKKVLLAEDNALNAEIAIELLQSVGLRVDVAENGAVAVEKFEASGIGEYFAIFMDMQMPVMNGIEATRKIRASGREDKDILIFAMTANTLTRDRKSCEEAGMDGYISKPVNMQDIENTLNENLQME